MLARRSRWGVGLLGLAALSGCQGGLMVNAGVLLVTVGIFVATLLLERAP